MAIRGKAPTLVFPLFAFILLLLPTHHGLTRAEVITDGTLGGPAGPVGSGAIPGVGTTTYHITDSLGKRAGQNLFHSFSGFNVGTGESATFTGSSGIRNILSRVTGGSYSSIDGTLRSAIQGANLYFFNPWGVVFGPNASLDVKGSFHVSTADYLRFEDGLRFYSAPGAADQVLSTASPAAFGFLTANPGPVYAVRSLLGVPAGETLSIISGEIGLFEAYVAAPGGQISLAGMSSSGEVVPSPAGQTPDLQVQPERASGSVGIHGSVVDVRGAPSGTVLIRSGRLVLDQGSWVTADNFGNSVGAGIDIRAASLDVSGGSSISAHSQDAGKGGHVSIEATESVRLSDLFSSISSESWASADSGGISVTTPFLAIENEAWIDADALGQGKGGEMEVSADTVSITGGGSISSSSLAGSGGGGNILIRATDSVSISGKSPGGYESALLSFTAGDGDAGAISVFAPSVTLSDGAEIKADTLGAGRGGDVTIVSNTMSLTGGANISSNTIAGTGHGGNLTVNATEEMTISGIGSNGNPSGLYTLAAGAGRAGDIRVAASTLTLDDGAGIGADTVSSGSAGNIELSVQRLNLSGGAMMTSESVGGSGSGGNIVVSAAESGILSNRSVIATSTSGEGSGGDITISSNALTLREQAHLSADTSGRGQGGTIGVIVGSLTMSDGSGISSNNYGGTGDGGQVTVQTDNGISLTGSTTAIASGSLGSGKGGDTQIRAAELQLADGAQITATSKGTGDAGNIDITLTDTLISRNGKVNTSSKNADGGNIDITADYIVYLKDSEITASVGGGASTVGGNISIDPQYVILDHSKIIANAYEGQGGNIRIVANVFLADPHSVVDASSALGIDGTVDIRAPITEISGTLVPLGEDFISAFELLREPCMARIRGGKYSSFIVSGRDGLPVEPGALLPSPMP